jgi:serine/threonine protein kinase
MECMSKGSLDKYLQSDIAITWKQRWKLAADVSKGLYHLHYHDPEILHRDLKSLNVLVDDQDRAKLTDFGLAEVKSETRNTTKIEPGKLAGSLLWMAPELFSMEAKTTKETDIFALAIILWEIAARKYPYEKVDNISMVPALLFAGQREEIPGDTPSSFKKIIERCWAQRAEDRLSINQIVEELEAHSGEAEEDPLPPKEHSCCLTLTGHGDG